MNVVDSVDFLAGPADDAVLSERALSKLRWGCRRGLLENDLFIADFFNAHAERLTFGQARALYALMDLSDNDLLDLLLVRTEPEGDLRSDAVLAVLALLRRPAVAPAA